MSLLNLLQRLAATLAIAAFIVVIGSTGLSYAHEDGTDTTSSDEASDYSSDDTSSDYSSDDISSDDTSSDVPPE